MITHNPLTNTDNLSVLQQIELENNLTEIRVDRGILAYFPIFISLGITLFGLFGFIAGLTTNQLYIYLGLAFAGALILFIEHQRTMLLVDYYSTKLEEFISDDIKKPIFGLFMALVFTGVFIGLDMFGANSMSIYVKSAMIENKVINSEAYKLAKKEAENGTRKQNIYLKEMEEWRKAQRMHNFTCASLPKNYVSKKIACKKEFYIKNPKPKLENIKSSGDVGLDTFQKLQNEAKASFNKYDDYFYYAFFTLSLLLNYLAVSSIFNQYRAKSKELTTDMIEVLRDRFESMKTAKLNKMRESNNAINSKLEESYLIDVELEKSTYDINIKRKSNILANRVNTVNNIEYVEAYPKSKTGFINIVKPKGYNQAEPIEDIYNESVKPSGYNQIDLDLFDAQEQELIKLLWSNVNVVGDSLTTRNKVLETIGNTKINTIRLRDLYKKLMELDYIYKKIGYFAKVEL